MLFNFRSGIIRYNQEAFSRPYSAALISSIRRLERAIRSLQSKSQEGSELDRVKGFIEDTATSAKLKLFKGA